jgi:hypothetical protein
LSSSPARPDGLRNTTHQASLAQRTAHPVSTRMAPSSNLGRRTTLRRPHKPIQVGSTPASATKAGRAPGPVLDGKARYLISRGLTRQDGGLLIRMVKVRILPREPWSLSSIGRASPRQGEGNGIETRRDRHASMAQWIKAPGYEPGACRFDSCWTRVTISSSAAERLPYKQRCEGSSPSRSTVIVVSMVSMPGCEPGGSGSEPDDHPQASVAQRRPLRTVNPASHTEVRVLPGAPPNSWRRIHGLPSEGGIPGSTPGRSTEARFSLARAVTCKADRQDGSIPSRASTGP